MGTAHGAYKRPPKLDFERIRTIAELLPIPLVLHGGSGLSDADFKKAIQEGISKVNIFTDINVAAVEAEFSAFDNMNKGIIDLIPAAVNAVRAEVGRKLQLFGCTGKAVTNSPSKAELIRIVVNEVLKELKNK